MTSSPAKGSSPAPESIRYDIAILGRHLSANLLAAVLARHGARVAIIPAPDDGGLPAGETTIPYTAELFFLLGNRFDVPEITAMGMYGELPAELRRASGVKRNLGFLYHAKGERHRPAQALQFAVPGEHAEWHVWRPDADSYTAALAGRLGAAVFTSQAAPHGVKVTDSGVTVALADGRVAEAEFLVEASGHPDLRPQGLPVLDPGRARRQSRLLYGQLRGVAPFESVVPLSRHRHATPWSEGTLTHGFGGGMIQVAPFAGEASGRASVTVSLDPAVFPATPDSPEEEFRELAARFPDIGAQFRDAVPVRPWRRYYAWQAGVASCAGPRWFLFDRAAWRHDLLLSDELAVSLELVHATAAGLLDVLRSRDWTGTRMETASAFQIQLGEFHDELMAAGRAATSSFELWNAYLRVWLLWTILCAMSLKRARLEGERREGPDQWAPAEMFEAAAYWYEVPGGLPDLVSRSVSDLLRPGATPETARQIYARLREAKFVPPLFSFANPDARYYRFSYPRRLRMLLWIKTSAPADFKRLLTLDNITAVAQTHTETARQPA